MLPGLRLLPGQASVYQALYDILVVFFGEKRMDPGGNNRAYVRHGLEVLLICHHDACQFAVVVRQGAGGGLAYFANAETIKESSERRVLALLNCGKQVLCRFLAHSLHLRQFILGKAIQVGRCLNPIDCDELLDQLAAHAIDVQSTT